MIPRKPFYLIRHGETEANVTKTTAGGHLDSPLTAKGQQQAQDVAGLLHTLPVRPTRIIHSPMTRARDTAGFINKGLRLAMYEIDELREHIVGEWEGKPWADVMPHIRANVRPPGGENKDDFSLRVKKVLDDVLDSHDEPVMIVAHGGTFFSIMHLYDHAYDGHVDNCHLHYFEPCIDFPQFPWRVWQFDAQQDRLVKNAAPFCGSKSYLA